jgi:hypothetical protein
MMSHASAGAHVAARPSQEHRASTPLELFFDLTFVVAVSQAASGLYHGLTGGHPGDALVTHPLVRFGPSRHRSGSRSSSSTSSRAGGRPLASGSTSGAADARVDP